MRVLKIFCIFLPVLPLFFARGESYGFLSSVLPLFGPLLLFCAGAIVIITSTLGRSLRSLDTVLQSGLFALMACAAAALSMYLALFFLSVFFSVAAVLPISGLSFEAGLQAFLTLLAARVAYGVRFRKLSYAFMFVLGMSVGPIILHAFMGAEPSVLGPRLDSALWYPAIALALLFETRRVVVAGVAPAQLPADQDWAMRRRRSGRALLAVVGLGFLGAGALVALVAMSYDGYCYGFTDGKAPCSLPEALINQLSFGLIVLWPIVFLWGGLCALLGIQYARAIIAWRRHANPHLVAKRISA